MENLILIILLIINILLITPFLLINKKRKVLEDYFMQSIEFVQHRLGFIISINGSIRVGKSSLLSGLGHISERLIINDLHELIEKIKMIFHKLNFNDIDNVLMDYFSIFSYEDKDNFPDFDYITDFLIDFFKINKDKQLNNFIDNTIIRKHILDYAQAFFTLNVRNNYIQSKTPYYSHITGNFNLELNVDWLAIKNAYKHKDYAINDWVVILIDELTDEASAGSWMEDVKDLSGAKEYRRKFGQIHQERNRLITTKQDVMDEVKKYRNLTHSHIMLEDKVFTVGNHFWIHRLAEVFINIFLFFHKHLVVKVKYYFNKFRKRLKGISFDVYYDHYINEVNIVRKTSNYLYYLKQFLLSIGYNNYYGYILKRAEDIEKVSADRENFQFLIPTIECWGTYDSFYFKSMQSDLFKNSNTIAKEIDPDIIPNFFEEEELTNKIEKGVDSFEF